MWLSVAIGLLEASTFCVGFASQTFRAVGEGEEETCSAEGKVRNP